MSSILANKAIKGAIQEIAIRAEHEDPQSAVESFYDCNIISHLTNKNHQIIQGRRGTGKTHILHVLKQNLETSSRHCIFFDCKATGSAADISDDSFPVNHRAVQLMRDFLLEVHSNLLNYYSDIVYAHDSDRGNEISELLDLLYSECYSMGHTAEKYEYTHNLKEKASKANNENHKLSFSAPPFFSSEFSEDLKREQESGAGRNTSGRVYKHIVFPNINQCLYQLAEITKQEYVILIDEWSNLPLDIQPHFAEFLHCCFIPNRHITLKIAVVTGRTKYCYRKSGKIYGLEVGADISASMDLDAIYMYDKDPRIVYSNLYKILWMHLKAKNVLAGIEFNTFLETLFADQKSSVLLIRASEGNPRDFISILNCCIIDMDGLGDSSSWINCKIIHTAAYLWYTQDKETALNRLQKKFLSELIDYVVRQKNNRAFVLEQSYLEHPAFKGLIDARVLHIAQTGQTYFHLGKQNMAILVLDFGTYSKQLSANFDIHFLTNDDFENIVFSAPAPSLYHDVLYPFDNRRKFQLCFLDPSLNSEHCPSFRSFN